VAIFEFYSRELVAIDPSLLNVLLPIGSQIGHVVERERIREQDRLATVGQLAAGIAHDFNNILTPIILFTDLTSSRLPREGKDWTNLQEVLRSARRAKDLILQILSFSQPTSQPRDAIHIQPIIQEVTTMLRGILPANIDLRQHIDPTVGQVYADTIKIHQILMNLCVNAYHAMRPQGGSLTITLDQLSVDAGFIARYTELKAGNYVRITVTDTGHGIDRATMQRIFDPFFTTKAVGEGTGMGLSVVHGIVKSYEGAVTVDSGVGKGTTFRIYLPHAAAATARSEPIERTLSRGNERVLVVDDEISIATATQEILDGLGYSVTAKTSSIDALHLFRQSPNAFDLVITDLTMPGLSGAELIGELIRTRPDIPIMLVSGTSEALTPGIVRSTGVRAYLMKPFSAIDISRVIRDILDAKEPYAFPDNSTY
jgi:signal transduction histidine kinase/CheY-like chemotaxis protein